MGHIKDRAQLQQEIMKRRRTGGYPGEVEPPFHLSGIEMMYFMGRLDPQVIAEIIPPELTPAGTDWGTVAIYDVPHGWGMAPYTACILGFEVEGYAPVDGQPAQYLHSGLYSDRAGELLKRVFNTNYTEGWSRQHKDGEKFVGEAGFGEKQIMRMSGDASGLPYQTYSGTNRYIGRSQDGGLQVFSVAFTGEFTDVTEAEVEFFAGASEVLRPVSPIEYCWTVKLKHAAFTFSRPRKIGTEKDHAEKDDVALALMTLFAQSGRAAAIVRRDGTVMSLNKMAEHLFEVAGMPKPVSLSWLGPKIQPLINQVESSGSEQVTNSLKVELGDQSVPLILQALALDPAVFGPENLVIFMDELSTHAAEHDVRPVLRLLGLSEAEARIAAIVGSGESPAEAANDLNLSLNTVRSALKIIYDKLGIARQAELAKIVTRLETQAVG